MMKVLTIIGARPQFVKEAVIYKAFREKGINEILLHTGQHYDQNMSEIFFNILEIKEPEYNLGIGSGTHAYQTGKAMMGIEEVCFKEKPDCILVFGDTNATLAGAIVGAKLRIPVAHVEAGLRQEPRYMPEETNRVLTDRISQYLFCPTDLAIKNLKNENRTEGVYFVGDVMYDLFVKVRKSINLDEVLDKFDLKKKNYRVLTLHRDFNTDDRSRFENILKAVKFISERETLLFPIHPRTKKYIREYGFESYIETCKVIDPVGYTDLVALLCNSKGVITDSGGLQKESYFAGVPATVLMHDTGWMELVDMGWNCLVDADTDLIIEKAMNHTPKQSTENALYGHGNAGEKIADILINSFKGN